MSIYDQNTYTDTDYETEARLHGNAVSNVAWCVIKDPRFADMLPEALTWLEEARQSLTLNFSSLNNVLRGYPDKHAEALEALVWAGYIRVRKEDGRVRLYCLTDKAARYTHEPFEKTLKAPLPAANSWEAYSLKEILHDEREALETVKAAAWLQFIDKASA